MQEDVDTKDYEAATLHTPNSHSSSKKRWMTAAITMVILLGCGGGYYFVNYRTTITESSIQQYVKQVDFPLYYPTSLPKGYLEKAGSTKISSGIVFFTLSNGTEEVVLTEQAAPKTPPDFKKLQDTLSFKNIEVETGQAVLGQNLGLPSALLMTNTTLITLNATKNIPSDVLIDIIKSLHSIR